MHASTYTVLILSQLGFMLLHSCNGYWNPESFPNPQKDPKACGLSSPGWVCDPDGILIDRDRQQLNDEIQKFHTTVLAKCVERCRPCDDQPATFLGVAIGYRIQKSTFIGIQITTNHKIAKDFASKLANNYWNFGQNSNHTTPCQNTLIILLVTHDGFIEMYGGDDVRYRYELQDVVRQNVRHFANRAQPENNYLRGLHGCVQSYWSRLRAQHYVGGEDAPANYTWIVVGVVAGVVVVTIVVWVIKSFFC